MLSSPAAAARISLRRARADWPIVGAAGIITLLAATLLAAGPIYADSVALAGLHRALADAPVQDVNVQVSLRTTPDRAAETDAVVREALTGVLATTGGDLVRIGRSDTFALPGQDPDAVRDLVTIGFAEGIEGRATIVDGRWPIDDRSATDPVIPVAVPESVAGPLGLAVGDELRMDSRIDPALVIAVRVDGIFRIDDPQAAYWWAEPQALDGIVVSERFTTYGPFITTAANVMERATAVRTEFAWRALPDLDALRLDGIGTLGARTADLAGRIGVDLGDGASAIVTTALPEHLARAERSLLVSRTGVLLLTAQLAVLAAYAILLSAVLLVDHRRVDTAMLRSRGASAGDIALIAGIEGLALAVPAALLGPWLAVAGLNLFNVTGPLAGIGMRIAPSVSTDAYVAAAAAAAACVLALVLPAAFGARSVASVSGSISRGETRTVGQRLGIDIALLVVAGIGLWQLRHYGAPLTQSVQGTLGLDPLLVATPAIALLAGSIVALRLVPLIAGVIEGVTARGRTLVPSLGARQLARRPLRYTRAALLLMLAMATGLFTIAYTSTWTTSQADQATFQVGADVRVEPGQQAGARPRWALDRTYAAIPGVTAAMPVDRGSVRITPSARGALLAIDTATAPDIVDLRDDLTTASVRDLVTPLAAARPTFEPVVLPGQPTAVRFALDIEIRELIGRSFDEATDELIAAEVDPATIDGWEGLTTAVVVRDARGMLHRFPGPAAPIGGAPHEMTVPLGTGPSTTDTAGGFAYPLELVGVQVGVTLPPLHEATDATVTVRDVAGRVDGAWQPVALTLDRGWRATAAYYGRPPGSVQTRMRPDELSASTGERGLTLFPPVDEYGRGTALTFAPTALGAIGDQALPVIASRAFLEATAQAVGDELSLPVVGVQRSLRIVGSVDAFPTADPDEPLLLIDLPTLALVAFEGSDAVGAAEEWWLAVDPAERAAVVAALRDPVVGSRSVVEVGERTQALASDPVALGIIGALSIGVVAAAAFAIVGFSVSAAVSARERITEFALLRALGLSPGQLSGWLSMENAVLAIVALVAGTALGLLISWVVLPFVTVTQQAATPYPPVEVQIPWATILALVTIAVVTLLVTVAVLVALLRRMGLGGVLRIGED